MQRQKTLRAYIIGYIDCDVKANQVIFDKNSANKFNSKCLL
jgi:hypothetical protein